MILIVVFYFLTSFVCEARVFCGDSNASHWTPFGYACPVICATVANAINRLKVMDYKKTIFQDMIVEPLSDVNNVIYNIERSKHTKTKNNLYLLPYKRNIYYKNVIKYKRNADNSNNINRNKFKKLNTHDNIVSKESKNEIFNDNTFKAPKDDGYKIDDITAFVKKMATLLKRTDGNGTDFKNVSIKRRFNVDDTFVNIMTNILNKYVSNSFEFTKEMTKVILQKLFNTKVHRNLYDVAALLKYLRKTVYINKSDNNYMITLRPQNCVTVNVPGCFCKQGFVEKSGQCVKPAECLTDDSLLQYLHRIIVL